MTDTSARLAKCFVAVFPELTTKDVPKASTETIPQWDSVSSVTLFALIEEEFGITLDANVLEQFNSFERILNSLKGLCSLASDSSRDNGLK